MTSGYDKRDKRRLKVRILNVICTDMTMHMVHPDKRDVLCESDRFCCRNADHYSSDKTGAVCNTDQIYVIQRDPCFSERLAYHAVYVFKMMP